MPGVLTLLETLGNKKIQLFLNKKSYQYTWYIYGTGHHKSDMLNVIYFYMAFILFSVLYKFKNNLYFIYYILTILT